VELELVDPIPSEQAHAPVKEIGQVLVPPPTARYVVVSDIDDTVLQSDATHMLKMARNVFLGNAHTRLPFTGVAALYRALFTGKSGTEMNPLFYVSSSPWNLYDLLAQFFNLQGIPVGPVLFLRDWGITPEEILPTNHKEYKMSYIRQMLDFYPDMPFILLGDSGQEDPEIYAELVDAYPKRIQAVYIRNVTRDMKRPEMVQELAKKVVEAGSALVLADDSVAIAKHAIEMGFIPADALPSIQEEKRKDEAPPTPIEKMLGEEPQGEAPTVTVDGGSTAGTKQAVKEGAVEEVMKEAGKETTENPPTVVVEGKDAKQQKKDQT
jgi:phosphatidate phosphatase APP1